MMRSIALLTTFMDLPEGYGLVPVVIDQLKMLLEHDYKPALFAVKGFENHPDITKLPDGTIIKPFIPFLHLYSYFEGTVKQTHKVDAKGVYIKNRPFAPKTNFDKQVQAIEDMLEPELKKYDVVITHDIVFQIAFVVHNQAIRNIAKRNPKIKWLHWVHSGPSARPDKIKYPHILRYSDMSNSLWVSPNDSMRTKFAEMYDVPLKKVKYVYHVFDLFRFLDLHPFSRQLIEKHDLLNCDVLCVWATRLDHPVGKAYNKAIWLIAQMNKLCNAKLVFLNSWSASKKAKSTIKSLYREAKNWGLPEENLVFSSAEGANWEQGVPRKVVRDLLWIANLYVFPSQSETFSIATAEAAACKNLLVLNEDLDVLKELNEENALYVPWGSEYAGIRTDQTYNPNPQRFFMDRAKEVLEELNSIKPLRQQRKVLQRFTSSWIFKNQLQPLIEESK